MRTSRKGERGDGDRYDAVSAGRCSGERSGRRAWEGEVGSCCWSLELGDWRLENGTRALPDPFLPMTCSLRYLTLPQTCPTYLLGCACACGCLSCSSSLAPQQSNAPCQKPKSKCLHQHQHQLLEHVQLPAKPILLQVQRHRMLLLQTPRHPSTTETCAAVEFHLAILSESANPQLRLSHSF